MATASGEPARYFWPAGETCEVEVVGSGDPLIAVGLLPHANEPLGSAFAATLAGYRGELGRIALVGPIDPPPASHRFALPIDPVGYAAAGYLQPLAEQAEFAHHAVPVTAGQRRAATLRDRLTALRPDAVVLVHNDVGAIAPYLYANTSWPAVCRRLRADLAAEFPRWPALGAAWTSTLDDLTYAYFPAERIGVRGTECAGRYLDRALGVATLTVELPMFRWDADPVRLAVATAVGEWIARGASHTGDTDRLVHEVTAAVGDRRVPMVAAATNARVVWSVLAGVHETLTTSRGWRAGPRPGTGSSPRAGRAAR